MPEPDLGDVLTAATIYGDQRAAAERAAGDARLTAAQAALAGVQAEFNAYRAAHPDKPQPVTTPLLGMSAPANVWAERKAAVEKTGGKLQARRVFLSSLTDSLDLVKAAHAEGLYPVVSFKVGNDWAGVANGKYDAQLKALAGNLKALGKPVHVAFHHEPDTQSTPADVGEGGSAADFARMNHRAIDVMRPLAGNVTFGVIVNGWWFTNQARKLTDAQIEAWLPRSLRDKLDVIAADDYSPKSGEEAVVKTRNRVAWAQRVGGVKALGVGETNAFTAEQLTNVFSYVRSEPLFQGGYICVWNSQADAYLPLDQTGLLKDFQSLLRDWAT